MLFVLSLVPALKQQSNEYNSIKLINGKSQIEIKDRTYLFTTT